METLEEYHLTTFRIPAHSYYCLSFTALFHVLRHVHDFFAFKVGIVLGRHVMSHAVLGEFCHREGSGKGQRGEGSLVRGSSIPGPSRTVVRGTSLNLSLTQLP